jgi:hypothetical protein
VSALEVTTFSWRCNSVTSATGDPTVNVAADVVVAGDGVIGVAVTAAASGAAVVVVPVRGGEAALVAAVDDLRVAIDVAVWVAVSVVAGGGSDRSLTVGVAAPYAIEHPSDAASSGRPPSVGRRRLMRL